MSYIPSSIRSITNSSRTIINKSLFYNTSSKFVRINSPILSSVIFPSTFYSTSSILYNANTTAPTTRPFRVLGLQQVAIGSTDKSRLSNLWLNIFGLKKIGTFRSERENVDEDILSLGGINGNSNGASGAIEVDIMTPINKDKSPKVHDPPLNHIGLWIDNLPVAVEWMTKQGVRFTPGGIRKGASGFDVTFIHPKGNEQFPLCGEGVLIELVQAPKEVIEALGGSK